MITKTKEKIETEDTIPIPKPKPHWERREEEGEEDGGREVRSELYVTKAVENSAPVRCFIGHRRMYQDTRVFGVGWGPRLIGVFFGTAGAVNQKL